MQLELEMDKCNTWEKKLEIFHSYFSKLNTSLTIENQKLLCSTIYDHMIAIQNYDTSSLHRLKLPITLLKPTLSVTRFPEEDYCLQKVNLV